MKEEKFTTSITASAYEWATSDSLTDDMVHQQLEKIFSEPIMTINHNDDPEFPEPTRLFSVEQLEESFRLGYMAMCKTDFGRNVINKKIKKYIKPYNILRQMNVGEKKIFPNSVWPAARTAASKLKSEFGCCFKVTKLGKHGEDGDIEVLRKL